VKTGRLLAGGSRAHRGNPKIWAFLGAGAIGLLLAPLFAVPYYFLTLILGARTTRLPPRWWPILPFAFAMHHLTYWLGIVAGMLEALLHRPRA
jgi:hypothetical protein